MNLENADSNETPLQSEDFQDLPVNRTSHIPDIEFEDGTNIPEGTRYIPQISKTTTWYTPSESVAPANWQQQWNRLKSELEKIVFSVDLSNAQCYRHEYQDLLKSVPR